MKPTLHLLRLSPTPIFQQLQWEEALLRVDKRNWCLLNQGSPPAIVMGISTQVREVIDHKQWEQCPLPLIRRFSGGGTVVVDQETLFVTLICQADAIPVPPFPPPLMQWTAEHLYGPLFHSLPFQLRENDYTLGGRKWGGNAQSIIKGRWLHHSCLLWDYRSEYMDLLSLPPHMPAYRQERSHTDFLCRLRDHWAHQHLFESELVGQLDQHFTLVEGERGEMEEIAALSHRKVTCLLTPIEPL